MRIRAVPEGTPVPVLNVMMTIENTDPRCFWLPNYLETLLVQVLRGKRLVGELLLDPEQVAFVQGVPPEREEEHVFELISETDSERIAIFFFVLVHGFEDESSATQARVH